MEPLFGHAFTDAAVGGALIGVAAGMLLLFNGRIAGCSGIAIGALRRGTDDANWRWLFLAGLLGGGLLGLAFHADAVVSSMSAPTWRIVVGGLLVGVGTRVGNGCTSGHGVCGIGRLSPRSLIAAATFIGAGIATVALL